MPASGAIRTIRTCGAPATAEVASVSSSEVPPLFDAATSQKTVAPLSALGIVNFGDRPVCSTRFDAESTNE